MLFAIDIGNTNTVFSLFEEKKPAYVWRFQTNAGKTEDEYAASLKELFRANDLSFDLVEAVIVSSVVPNANFAIQRLCDKYFSKIALFVNGKDMDMGLDVKIDRPHELGADRLVNAVAAKAKYDMPCIIIDFGTATTFDVLDKDSNYIGGAIAPGVNLSIHALYEAAAKLPKIDLKKPTNVVATDTITAMQSGIYWGYVGLFESILKRTQEELGYPSKVIATGGLASLFAEDIPQDLTIDQDLTLYGLYCIYERNKDLFSSVQKDAA